MQLAATGYGLPLMIGLCFPRAGYLYAVFHQSGTRAKFAL